MYKHFSWREKLVTHVERESGVQLRPPKPWMSLEEKERVRRAVESGQVGGPSKKGDGHAWMSPHFRPGSRLHKERLLFMGKLSASPVAEPPHESAVPPGVGGASDERGSAGDPAEAHGSRPGVEPSEDAVAAVGADEGEQATPPSGDVESSGGSRRKVYTCKLCGQPKKGHTCTALPGM